MLILLPQRAVRGRTCHESTEQLSCCECHDITAAAPGYHRSSTGVSPQCHWDVPTAAPGCPHSSTFLPRSKAAGKVVTAVSQQRWCSFPIIWACEGLKSSGQTNCKLMLSIHLGPERDLMDFSSLRRYISLDVTWEGMVTLGKTSGNGQQKQTPDNCCLCTMLLGRAVNFHTLLAALPEVISTRILHSKKVLGKAELFLVIKAGCTIREDELVRDAAALSLNLWEACLFLINVVCIYVAVIVLCKEGVTEIIS